MDKMNKANIVHGRILGLYAENHVFRGLVEAEDGRKFQFREDQGRLIIVEGTEMFLQVPPAGFYLKRPRQHQKVVFQPGQFIPGKDKYRAMAWWAYESVYDLAVNRITDCNWPAEVLCRVLEAVELVGVSKTNWAKVWQGTHEQFLEEYPSVITDQPIVQGDCTIWRLMQAGNDQIGWHDVPDPRLEVEMTAA